jgi:hypothetical protein
MTSIRAEKKRLVPPERRQPSVITLCGAVFLGLVERRPYITSDAAAANVAIMVMVRTQERPAWLCWTKDD